MRLCITAVLVLTVLISPAKADDIWAAFGVGIGNHGIAGIGSGSIRIRNQGLLTIRFAGTQEPSSVNPDAGWFSGGPNFRIGGSDFGFLLGLITPREREGPSLSLSIGIGEATVIQKGEYVADPWWGDPYYKELKSTATSFVIQAELFSKKYGAQCFVDVNDIESFFGVTLSYRFGASSRPRGRTD